MNRSTLFRVVAVLLLVAVAIGGGAAVYDAGVNAGLQEAAAQAAAPGAPASTIPYAYGPYRWGPGGFGFGFFGIFFWILGFFLIFALLRAAFGRGRWGGPGRPAGRDPRRETIEEWHREMHRTDSGDPTRPVGARPSST